MDIRTRHPEKTKAEALEKYRSGMSVREVALRHGMGKGNVAKWLKKSRADPD